MTISSREENLTMSDLEMFVHVFDPSAKLSPTLQKIKNTLSEISTLRLEGLTETLTPEEKSQAAEHIAFILENNPHIEEVNLTNNHFSESDTKKIVKAIAENDNLEIVTLNNFTLENLAGVIPYFEKMASNTHLEELHLARSLPKAEMKAFSEATNNPFPEVAKQLLAIHFLYEEIHEEPIDFDPETMRTLGLLDSIEKKLIEHSLSGTKEPFIVEYADLEVAEEFKAFYETSDEEIARTPEEAVFLNTEDFISFKDSKVAEGELEIEDIFADESEDEYQHGNDSSHSEDNYSFLANTTSRETSSADDENFDFETPASRESQDSRGSSRSLKTSSPSPETSDNTPKDSTTHLHITTIAALEKLVSMMELYKEDSLDEAISEKLLKIEKLDLSHLYNKLDNDEQEEMVHLIVSIAEQGRHIKKINLGHNDFSSEHLQTIVTAFAEAQNDTSNQLKKLSLRHAIAQEHLGGVATPLQLLERKLGKHLSLDSSTTTTLKKQKKATHAASLETVKNYREACETYRDYLERKILLPTIRLNKQLRETYPGLDDPSLSTRILKRIIRDLTQPGPHPIKTLRDDPQFKMAIQKYQIVLTLENITKEEKLSSSEKKQHFEERYYQDKKELPQLLLKNDKTQYEAFLKTLGDTKALTNIKEIGYVAKSRKPTKPASPLSLFFKKSETNEKRDKKSKTERPTRPKQKDRH